MLSLFDGRPDSPGESNRGSSSSSRGRFRLLEAAVALLVLVIFVCFAVEVALSKPSLLGVLRGLFLPDIPALVTNGPKLYIAMGILGATVCVCVLSSDGFCIQTNHPSTLNANTNHR